MGGPPPGAPGAMSDAGAFIDPVLVDDLLQRHMASPGVLDDEVLDKMHALGVAVSFLPIGTCRNSLGPCALLFGPSTPVIRNCAAGNFSPSMPMKGIEPPSPM